ncbi:hypothetical protein LIER_14202 [Lithospermum erythrorhizon]|uniref:Uncharacterized protein n=1 Tax=Lithospermum erythrorhizon TaxID=34254 RepID=A0AAV3Q0S2_LITER
MAKVLARLKNAGVVATKGVIVSSTASRRRTRASAAALEKKRTTLGAERGISVSVEPSEAKDIEELERRVEEKNVAKKEGIEGDKFVVDDVEVSKDDDDLGAAMSSYEDNEARWRFFCARNILSERFLSESTLKNDTYVDILEESGMLAIIGDIGPHWPSLVREFICNLSEDIADPTNPMFH